jgi:glycosyltransferase involved in cell wall biosynthesis
VRVLLLAPHPFFQQRGTPIAERLLLEALAAHGHETEVLTFHEGEDPGLPGCRIHRIPRLPGIHGIRPGFSAKKLACDALMLGACLRLIRKRRYDLVHAVEESAFMALLARRLFGVPYVYDMDSLLAQQMIDKFPPLARVRGGLEWFERLAVRGSSGVLAVCRSIEEKAREYDPQCLVARLEDVTLLPEVASRPEERESLAALAGFTGEARGPIVLYVGNLETYQGIDLLLAGFACAAAQVPGARLVVIGGAPEHIRHYQEVAARAGIGESVRFAGPRPVEKLGDYLGQATVLVSPRTQGTNTPMKVYSYLDSGRPLLATRLPTHTQVLDDEVACLVEPEPEDFARGLVLLLTSEPLRERLAGNARALSQREFTPAAFTGKLLRFYEAVAQKIGNPPAHAEPPHSHQPAQPQVHRRG